MGRRLRHRVYKGGCVSCLCRCIEPEPSILNGCMEAGEAKYTSFADLEPTKRLAGASYTNDVSSHLIDVPEQQGQSFSRHALDISSLSKATSDLPRAEAYRLHGLPATRALCELRSTLVSTAKVSRAKEDWFCGNCQLIKFQWAQGFKMLEYTPSSSSSSLRFLDESSARSLSVLGRFLPDTKVTSNLNNQ